MTRVAERRSTPRELRLASVVSEVLGPMPVGVALCVGVGAASDGVAGAGWGLLAILFAAVIPYIATWRLRHPNDGGRPSTRTRLAYLFITLASAATGLALVAALGAPHDVVVVATMIVVGLVAGGIVNIRWRASNHVAGLAGAVTALSVIYTAVWLAAIPLVVVLGYARVRLSRHSVREVAGGAALGAIVGTVVTSLLV